MEDTTPHDYPMDVHIPLHPLPGNHSWIVGSAFFKYETVAVPVDIDIDNEDATLYPESDDDDMNRWMDERNDDNIEILNLDGNPSEDSHDSFACKFLRSSSRITMERRFFCLSFRLSRCSRFLR